MFCVRPETNLIKFINNWKSSTSKYLRNKHSWIKNLLRKSLWSRSYFLRSIGDIDFETIEKYIQEQGNGKTKKRS
jgi:putative transposase